MRWIRSLLLLPLVLAALTTLAQAEHPFRIALHIKNSSGATVTLYDLLNVGEYCAPTPRGHGVKLENGRTELVNCDPYIFYGRHPESTRMDLISVFSGDPGSPKSERMCSLGYQPGRGVDSHYAFVGQHCYISERGDDYAILIR
jgi:hypothetical protein